MKRGYELGGKFANDPVGSDVGRGKNRELRKSSRDGNSLTPTEQHKKNELMRQFMRTGEGGGGGNKEAYVNSPVWCDCGRRMKLEGRDVCVRCDMTVDERGVEPTSGRLLSAIAIGVTCSGEAPVQTPEAAQ
jgi:hypothetical protein